MTSLTPNEDAYLSSIKVTQAEFEKACAEPGMAGMQMRVIVATSDALNLAVMREIDRGMTPNDCVAVVTVVAANILTDLCGMINVSPEVVIEMTVSNLARILKGEGRGIEGGAFTPETMASA